MAENSSFPIILVNSIKLIKIPRLHRFDAHLLAYRFAHLSSWYLCLSRVYIVLPFPIGRGSCLSGASVQKAEIFLPCGFCGANCHPVFRQ